MSDSAIRQVGIIGLGAMGSQMASHLLSQGFSVAGYDIREESRARLAAEGGTAARSPAEAASGADAIIIIVLNYEQVRTVLSGPDGILSTLAPDSLVLLMSTISPAQAREAGALCAEQGVRMLDAPVSGGVARAGSGELSIMVGGPDETVAAARPLLEALGDAARIAHVGPNLGDGSAMKMVNQLLVGIHIVAAAEAMALAARLGLDPDQVYEVISASMASSQAFVNRVPRLIEGTFTPTISRLDIFVKDLTIVAESTAELGLELPLMDAARRMFESGVAEGLAAEDDIGLIRHYERQTGVEARRHGAPPRSGS
jgi:putative dehydrogenase